MRVTSKGQVTIPRHFREKLGIAPNSGVEFWEEGRVYLLRKRASDLSKRFKALRDYFLYVKNVRKCARSTSTVAIAGIRFFFENTLERPWPILDFISQTFLH